MTFTSNYMMSQQYMPEVRRIVGPFLLQTATWEQDVKEASDLVVMQSGAHRIAVRVRNAKFSDSYPHEFTIRSGTVSGNKTELQKIEDGMGDWLFYGYAHATRNEFVRWMIINLDSFRAHLIRRPYLGPLGKEVFNKDGSRFYAYDVRNFSMTPKILIASSHPHEHQGLINMAA